MTRGISHHITLQSGLFVIYYTVDVRPSNCDTQHFVSVLQLAPTNKMKDVVLNQNSSHGNTLTSRVPYQPANPTGFFNFINRYKKKIKFKFNFVFLYLHFELVIWVKKKKK